MGSTSEYLNLFLFRFCDIYLKKESYRALSKLSKLQKSNLS